MATYKKRGYKPKTKKESDQIEEMDSTTAEVFSTLDETASKTEEWVAKNQKYILGIIGVAVVGVLGFLGYQQFIVKPADTEASNEMFFAQQYFDEAVNSVNNDSLYALALNGADGKYGLLDIIDNYKGTKSANLAKYSAGMAYLNMSDYNNAISYLQDFKSNDMILGALAKGGIGDAFVQLNQPEEALQYYERAFKHNDNAFTAPKFLFKAGIVAMDLGQNAKAVEYFQKIKDDYSTSEEGRTIDIYLGKAENL